MASYCGPWAELPGVWAGPYPQQLGDQIAQGLSALFCIFYCLCVLGLKRSGVGLLVLLCVSGGCKWSCMPPGIGSSRPCHTTNQP